MTTDQWLIIGILALTVGSFLWGKLRHDFVALGALLACVIVGVVPSDEAFNGFANPAVITVLAVLILSKALEVSGAIDILGRKVLPKNAGVWTTALVLFVLGAVLSAFINNVGAMALLMPLAIRLANDADLPPGKVLMPLAFATILGGMTTLIGTPPNLIVSGYRSDAVGEGFGMFSFTPVGLTVAVAGIIFLVLAGRKLVPTRKPSSADNFDVGGYRADFIVRADSWTDEMTIAELEERLADASFKVPSLERDGDTFVDVDKDFVIKAGDRLHAKAGATLVRDHVENIGLDVVHRHAGGEDEDLIGADQSQSVREMVILPTSRLRRTRVKDVHFSKKYNIDLLAVSSKGGSAAGSLDDTKLHAGDVLFLQGDIDLIGQFAATNNCVPLAERNLQIPSPNAPALAVGIMVGSVLLAALSPLSTAVSFMIGAFLVGVTSLIPVRKIYEAVDWSVIMLLAAMLPVAAAMQTTGAADKIAQFMLDNLARGSAIAALTIVLVLTMFMSDAMNNAATAAVMCPISLQSAAALDVNPDTFLMAVAIGASCAFLTPIGHQNNTLILGPGGFKFGDYWKFGLPLEVVIVVVGIPALLLFWPL